MNEKMERWLQDHPDATLREAAIKGMEFDSNNWCNKVR